MSLNLYLLRSAVMFSQVFLQSARVKGDALYSLPIAVINYNNTNYLLTIAHSLYKNIYIYI